MASEEQDVFQNAEHGVQLMSAITKFTLEVYRQQRKRVNGNMFLSPLSISSVLNMAYLGAKGKTQEEMKRALYLHNLDDSKVHQAFGDLALYLNRCSTQVPSFRKEPVFRLLMANRLYCEKAYTLLPEFQDSCRKYYCADITSVSFTKEPIKAVKEINSWVSENTNQKIKDILTSGDICDDTRLILVNAIYFKSEWDKKFKIENTKDDDFVVSPTETLKVKMMYRDVESAMYFYSEELSCQVLKLPYLHNALSMFILLPDKTSGSMEKLEDMLTIDHLENLDSGFKEYPDVKLWLPKFKIEEKLEAREILREMGMASLFAPGSADLSGIDGSKLLYASKVMHKAYVDVNEDGTEAAAATAMTIRTCCLHIPQKIVDFRADHPFLFFIREEKSKAILFVGRVLKPNYE